jgi:hypothetical protein
LGELHLKIFLINPRKIGGQLIGVIRLDNVDSESATPFQLTPPERLDIESRAPERASEIPVKILKKSVDFTAQAFRTDAMACDSVERSEAFSSVTGTFLQFRPFSYLL